jgi:hypothetical protein
MPLIWCLCGAVQRMARSGGKGVLSYSAACGCGRASWPEVTERPDFTHKRTYQEHCDRRAGGNPPKSRLNGAGRPDRLLSGGDTLADRRGVATHCIPLTTKLRPFCVSSYAYQPDVPLLLASMKNRREMRCSNGCAGACRTVEDAGSSDWRIFSFE